jgi:pyruvate/2-oxoglutarate dehydrogenase complex dihydrolipoamide dehydrogenase (E3) component
MKAVKARKDRIAGQSRSGLEKSLRSLENCTIHMGHARFTGAHTVAVGEDSIEAPRIFIDVGGRPLVPDMPGLQGSGFLTSDDLLGLDMLPEKLVIVGGSYVGLEFGQMYRRFGAEVAVVEMGPRLVGKEDPDVSDEIANILESDGIEVRLNAKCIAVDRDSQGISINVDCQSGDKQVRGSHVLIAVGRTPNTDDLGLDAAGIERDDRGYIRVGDDLQTNVSGVYALGDCNGRGAFTHTAYNDYEIVAANLLDGAHRKVTDRHTIYALFIDPPLGRVGMTESEAKEAGHRVLVGKREMTRVSRAVQKDETQGFMKVVVDRDTEKILGAAILGTSGDEVVQTLVDAVYAGLSYRDVSQAVRIHPTVSELIPTVLQDLHEA